MLFKIKNSTTNENMKTYQMRNSTKASCCKSQNQKSKSSFSPMTLINVVIFAIIISTRSVQARSTVSPSTEASSFIKDLLSLAARSSAPLNSIAEQIEDYEDISDMDTMVEEDQQLSRKIRSVIINEALFSSINRPTTRHCTLTRSEFVIRKEGCKETKIEINMCQGLCRSKEVIIQFDFDRRSNVCMPTKTVTKAIELEGCVGVDSIFYVTEPAGCECKACNPVKNICEVHF